MKMRKSKKPNFEQADQQGKIKRIKLRGNTQDDTKSLNQQYSQTSNAPGTKIKLKLKKNIVENVVNAEPKPAVKLKLNLKRDSVSPLPNSSSGTKAPKIRIKPPRIPGEGYDSEASDIEEDPLIEEGVILRVLPDFQADFIKNSIENADYSGISIKWKGERHAVIKINGNQYGAVLVELPTVIEVNKSVDGKNLMKTFDVSQMLLCIALINREEEVFELNPPDSEDLVKKHFEAYSKEIFESRKKMMIGYQGGPLTDAESKHAEAIINKPYDYKHGISPPLYNVRNRRFRRRMGPAEMEHVEKTVEMLLKQDAEAEEFSYDLVEEESLIHKTSSSMDSGQFTGQRKSVSPSQTTIANTSIDSMLFCDKFDCNDREHVQYEDNEDLELELEQALQDSSDTEKAGEIYGDEPVDEPGDEVEQYSGEEEHEDDDDDDEEEDEEFGQKPAKPETNEDVQHNELLKDELGELESILQQNRDKLAKATNPLLKSRFIDSINKLEKEVEIKRKQLITSEEALLNNNSIHPDPKIAPTSNTRQTEEDDEEDDEEEDDDDDEEEEVDEEEDDKNNNDQDRSQRLQQEEELDQDDMDMMMLFGVEGDD